MHFQKKSSISLRRDFSKKFDSGNYRSGESKGESLGRHVLRVHGNFSQKSHIRAEGGRIVSQMVSDLCVLQKKKLFPNFRHTCGESNGESFASYEQFVAKKTMKIESRLLKRM